MIRTLIAATGLIIFYFIYGIYLSQSGITVISNSLKKNPSSDFYDYRGVMNVRTNRSNGSSSPLEVIKSAKRAGLDFIFLTDVDQFESSENISGYLDDVLVSSEGEYSFLDSRLLVYQLNSNFLKLEQDNAQLQLTDLLSKSVSEKKDFLIVLASPFRKGQSWSGAYPSGLDGIEIVNPKVISENAWLRSKLSVLWSFVIYPFNSRYAFLRLFREPEEELSLFDRLSKDRATLAFSGADASARAIPFANTLIKFPSYQSSFEISQNHILLKSELTGNYQKDRAKLLTALKAGNFYSSLDILGDPTGFNAVVEDDKNVFMMGDRVKINKSTRIKAKLPQEPRYFYELVVFKDGERFATSNEPTLDVPIKEAGVYRVTVRVSPLLPFPEGKRWFTWIYTNNFYLY